MAGWQDFLAYENSGTPLPAGSEQEYEQWRAQRTGTPPATTPGSYSTANAPRNANGRLYNPFQGTPQEVARQINQQTGQRRVVIGGFPQYFDDQGNSIAAPGAGVQMNRWTAKARLDAMGRPSDSASIRAFQQNPQMFDVQQPQAQSVNLPQQQAPFGTGGLDPVPSGMQVPGMSPQTQVDPNQINYAGGSPTLNYAGGSPTFDEAANQPLPQYSNMLATFGGGFQQPMPQTTAYQQPMNRYGPMSQQGYGGKGGTNMGNQMGGYGQNLGAGISNMSGAGYTQPQAQPQTQGGKGGGYQQPQTQGGKGGYQQRQPRTGKGG